MSSKHRKTRKHHVCWTPAGTLTIRPDARPAVIDAFSFGADELVEKSPVTLDWVEKNRGKQPVLWVNVEGLGSLEVIERLGALFELHQLSLEDVLNVHQRAKTDIYEGYHFVILPMLRQDPEKGVESEQLCLFWGKDYVLTFQEGVPGDCLDPVRHRLRQHVAGIRAHSADFLAYCLIDAVIDSYFPLLEELGEELEQLEDLILLRPGKRAIRRVHDIKRALLVLRRAIWPIREAITPLFHDDSGLIGEETKVFLRDCFEHSIQVLELVESYREVCASLMDVYLSSLSNRMNEVMKMLTIITTVFVPLTFIAGVYGMNFNPAASPYSMPELNSYWGYPLCLAVMFVLAVGEMWFFWRKGWLFSNDGADDSLPTPPSARI
jgi:magnesium transporter